MGSDPAPADLGYLEVKNGARALDISWEAYNACYELRQPFVRLLLNCDGRANVYLTMDPTGKRLNAVGLAVIWGTAETLDCTLRYLRPDFVKVENMTDLAKARELAALLVRIATAHDCLEPATCNALEARLLNNTGGEYEQV